MHSLFRGFAAPNASQTGFFPEYGALISTPVLGLCGLTMLLGWSHSSDVVSLVAALFIANSISAFGFHFTGYRGWGNIDGQTLRFAVWLVGILVLRELREASEWAKANELYARFGKWRDAQPRRSRWSTARDDVHRISELRRNAARGAVGAIDDLSTLASRYRRAGVDELPAELRVEMFLRIFMHALQGAYVVVFVVCFWSGNEVVGLEGVYATLTFALPLVVILAGVVALLLINGHLSRSRMLYTELMLRTRLANELSLTNEHIDHVAAVWERGDRAGLRCLGVRGRESNPRAPWRTQAKGARHRIPCSQVGLFVALFLGVVPWVAPHGQPASSSPLGCPCLLTSPWPLACRVWQVAADRDAVLARHLLPMVPRPPVLAHVHVGRADARASARLDPSTSGLLHALSAFASLA